MTDQEKIDVIQAQIDGKVIECGDLDPAVRHWDGGTHWNFNFNMFVYRIKVDYVEITVNEAFELLAGYNGSVKCHCTDDKRNQPWVSRILTGADSEDFFNFRTNNDRFRYCRVPKEVYDAR